MTPIERLRALGARHIELWKAAGRVWPKGKPIPREPPPGWVHDTIKRGDRKGHATLRWVGGVAESAPKAPPKRAKGKAKAATSPVLSVVIPTPHWSVQRLHTALRRTPEQRAEGARQFGLLKMLLPEKTARVLKAAMFVRPLTIDEARTYRGGERGFVVYDAHGRGAIVWRRYRRPNKNTRQVDAWFDEDGNLQRTEVTDFGGAMYGTWEVAAGAVPPYEDARTVEPRIPLPPIRSASDCQKLQDTPFDPLWLPTLGDMAESLRSEPNPVAQSALRSVARSMITTALGPGPLAFRDPVRELGQNGLEVRVAELDGSVAGLHHSNGSVSLSQKTFDQMQAWMRNDQVPDGVHQESIDENLMAVLGPGLAPARKSLHAGSSMRTLVHEEVHGMGPNLLSLGQHDGSTRMIEEFTTEACARVVTKKLFPNAIIHGSYEEFFTLMRDSLVRAVEEGGDTLTPEQATDLLARAAVAWKTKSGTETIWGGDEMVRKWAQVVANTGGYPSGYERAQGHYPLWIRFSSELRRVSQQAEEAYTRAVGRRDMAKAVVRLSVRDALLAAMAIPFDDEAGGVAVWRAAARDGVATSDVLRLIIMRFTDPVAAQRRMLRAAAPSEESRTLARVRAE